MNARKRKRIVMAAIGASLGLSGCAFNPGLSAEQLAIDNISQAQGHPRALLMARIQPACLMFCTTSVTVTNSEGVKAATQGGDLTTTESQAPVTTQTASPQFTNSPTKTTNAAGPVPAAKE